MIKNVAKKIVGKNYWSYGSWHNEKFGLLSTANDFLYLCIAGIGKAANPLTTRPVFLRPGTSDQDVYNEIFLAKEYDISLGNPRVIIDAGAHIGLSSVYFASRYPNATVIAIEPEPSNFAVLLKNAQFYPNIKPIQAGLWSKKTHLKIENSNVETWSFRVIENSLGEGIPAVCIEDVMREFGIDLIDVLKIDIEGSEIEVLNHSQPWMDKVKTIIIELHDRFQPGCSDSLSKAVKDFDYSESTSGESVVMSNLKKKSKITA